MRTVLWPVWGAFFLTVFLITGCATVYTKPADPVFFRSEPEGAEVYINGRYMGSTPLKIRLYSGPRYSVDFVKDGDETRCLRIESRTPPGWILLDLAGGLVPESIHTEINNYHSRRQVTVIAELVPERAVQK